MAAGDRWRRQGRARLSVVVAMRRIAVPLDFCSPAWPQAHITSIEPVSAVQCAKLPRPTLKRHMLPRSRRPLAAGRRWRRAGRSTPSRRFLKPPSTPGQDPSRHALSPKAGRPTASARVLSTSCAMATAPLPPQPFRRVHGQGWGVDAGRVGTTAKAEGRRAMDRRRGARPPVVSQAEPRGGYFKSREALARAMKMLGFRPDRAP